MLLNEDFSDMRFVCEGGEEFPAHKAVLAAASDYFKTLFSGRWKTTAVDGKLETRNPPHIVKAMLSFIYTGSISDDLLDEHNRALVESSAWPPSTSSRL